MVIYFGSNGNLGIVSRVRTMLYNKSRDIHSGYPSSNDIHGSRQV